MDEITWKMWNTLGIKRGLIRNTFGTSSNMDLDLTERLI